MSWLIPEPKLNADERVLWRKPGSITLRTAVGGTLYVTSARILFVPNRLNTHRNRQVREWPLPAVQSVDVQGRDFTAYTGGMHNRLRLTLATGEHLLFVIKGLGRSVAELQDIIGRSRG